MKIGRAANLEGVSEKNPREEAYLALTRPGFYGVPHFVFFSEGAWLDLADLCRDVGGWHHVQHGEKGSPEAGVSLAARTPLESLPLVVGSRATSEGDGGVRMRPIVGARALEWGNTPLWAVHAPPPDSPRARAAYVTAARRRRGILGGDWNFTVHEMQSRSEREYRGEGVLGTLSPTRYGAGAVKTVDIHSDHRGVDVPFHGVD